MKIQKINKKIIMLLISLLIIGSLILIIKINPSIKGNAIITFSIAKDIFRECSTITANIPKTINTTINSKIILSFSSNKTICMDIAEYMTNPEENTIGFAEIELRYLTINTNTTIIEGLNYFMIYIYYDNNEIRDLGLEESSLQIYWYNNTLKKWQTEKNWGLNTIDNYVWVNTTHFSTFGIGGSSVITIEPEKEKKAGRSGKITGKTIDLLFDVKINILDEYKEIIAGNPLVSEITIYNVGEKEEKRDTLVIYSIKNLENKIIISESETITINRKTSFIKKIYIPKKIEPGEYIFDVEIKYNNQTAKSNAMFKIIKEEIPFSFALYFKIIIFIGGAIIILLIIILYKIKNNHYKKK